MRQKIRTIFIGTSEFGLPAFRALSNNENFELIACVTQPDRQAGRGQKLSASPIKIEAQTQDLKILQPEKIFSIKQELQGLRPELIIVASYGQIIPQAILDIPPYKCLNIHGSLLPKYRGSACIQAAILNGDQKSGVTIMEMNARLDAGAIIHQAEVAIDPEETSKTLHDKISKLAGKIICQICLDYIDGRIKAKEQDDELATHVKIIKKENGRINWMNKAEKIEKFVRAMQTWPGAYSYLPVNDHKKLLKIIKAEIALEKITKSPGMLWTNTNNNLLISAQDCNLNITEIQIEGGKKISAQAFINGHKNLLNTQLI